MEQKHVFTKGDIDIVDVTPLQAQAWLSDCNKKNRRQNKGHVRKIAEQMKKGQWQFNGDTICFDWNNNLIDGQHRLAAQILCGIVVRHIVVRNLDPDCFLTKDIEMKTRSLADLLSMDGVKDANHVAAIVKKTVMMSTGNIVIKGGNSSDGGNYSFDSSTWDKYELYYKYQSTFDDVTRIASRFYSKRRAFLLRSEIGGIYAYLIIYKDYNVEKINDFFSQLYYGNETCPAITSLRDKLNKDSDKGNVMLGSYKQSLIIKTWNYFVSGSKIKNVNYNHQKEGKVYFQ